MSGLPKGWAIAKIGDVINPFDVIDPLKMPDLSFRYIDIGSINNKNQTIENTKEFFGKDAPSRARRLVRTKDVLFSTVRTYLKNIAQVPSHLDRSLTSTGICVLRPVSGIYSDYIFRWVSSSEFIEEISKTQDGTLYPAVTDKDVFAGYIPVAPTAEQRRIVVKLDSLFARITRARAELNRISLLVERYKQAILSAAFSGELTRDWRERFPQKKFSLEMLPQKKKCEEIGWQPEIETPENWEWICIDKLSSLVEYGSSGKTNDNPNGIPVFRMGNIEKGCLSAENLKYLPENHFDFPKLLLKIGDVLFNRTNSAELVGKTAVYKGIPEKSSFASYLIRLRFDCIIPELVSHYINSSYGRSWVASVANQQVGQANVNGTKLKQLAVPVMHEDEQKEIVRRIEKAFAAMDAVAQQTAAALRQLSHLEAQCLNKAFRGELVPQDPNDEPASALLDRIRAARTTAPQPRRRQKQAV